MSVPNCQGKCPCMEQCPLQTAMNTIGGKWKVPILCALRSDGETRYNDLKRKIAGITNTMLASSLKELERDGLVRRMQYPEMPVRVEYSLTENADMLVPILKQMASWGVTLNGLKE